MDDSARETDPSARNKDNTTRMLEVLAGARDAGVDPRAVHVIAGVPYAWVVRRLKQYVRLGRVTAHVGRTARSTETRSPAHARRADGGQRTPHRAGGGPRSA